MTVLYDSGSFFSSDLSLFSGCEKMSYVALKERVQGLVEGRGESGFGWSSTAEEVTEGLDLAGRVVLVTGCNSGLGKETMRVLTMRGARVFGAARSEDKARRACADVEGKAVPVVCDLSDPGSVVSCADDLASRKTELDAIICNAGIMALPERERVHGYEKQFFVNHVGHFILVTELLDFLADNGRVVTLSSVGHRTVPEGGIAFDDLSAEGGYNRWVAYGQSKLANLLFARELARRFEEDQTDRTANAVHPGVIHTNLTRNMGQAVEAAMSLFSLLFLKSIPQGAATETYVAVHPDAADYNGEYFVNCNPRESSEYGRDEQLAQRLWEKSVEIKKDLLG